MVSSRPSWRASAMVTLKYRFQGEEGVAGVTELTKLTELTESPELTELTELTELGAPLGFMNGVQLLDQLLISQFPNAGLALAPPVIAAASRLQHLAHGLNWIIVSK